MHKDRHLRVFVHGDDFVVTGTAKHIAWAVSVLNISFSTKEPVIIGPENTDQKELIVLNRKLTWSEDGEMIAWEADYRHVDTLITQLNLEKANSVTSPGVKERKPEADEEEPVDAEKITLYRSCTMRIAYLATGRLDLSYAIKEAARKMQNPTCGDIRR